MLLDTRMQYLILEDQADPPTRSIRLAPDLTGAVSRWRSSSRLSPVWPIQGFDGTPQAFAGTHKLLFVGPAQPAELFASVPGLAEATGIGAWLTAGCFNIVLRIGEDDGPALHAAVLDWIRARDLSFESWSLRDGLITGTEHAIIGKADAQPAIDALAAEAAHDETPVLRPAFQENVIVTATSLARAAAVYPPIFDRLNIAALASCETARAYREGRIGVLEMQSRLLSMNAALSRFSSQAFSGVPPILGTECHFWIHSLLGTGSANIALDNLVSAIQQVLGEARLPERLALLETKTAGVPDKTRLVSDAQLLRFDILAQTEHDAITDAGIVPLVTYFSGRDGFSSQLQTLSAPLTTLAECNSYRSNLLTVTHEISHIFIQAVLSVLAPSLGNDTEMAIVRKVARPGFHAANHLDAARQLLVEAVITMESARGKLPANQVNVRLPGLFERWRTEMQEILVHAFDFLYFHQGDPEFYVKSIWHSWCSIPGISDRVPEYLMRTLCSVAVTLLEAGSATLFDAVVANTRELLTDIQPNIDPASNYVEQALTLLRKLDDDEALREQTQKDFAARLYLVRLVRIYLFSERLAAMLFDNPYARSHKSGDVKRKLHYDRTPLGNALTFLKDQLRENPSEAESLWVLHCLAFDLRAVPEPIQ